MRRGDRGRLAAHARSRCPRRDDLFGELRPTWTGTVERVEVVTVPCTCWLLRRDALPLLTRDGPPNRTPLPGCHRCHGAGECQAERVTCRHAAEDCGWLFLDTSRSGRRRWCSMQSCGNRAKARRFYARATASSEA